MKIWKLNNQNEFDRVNADPKINNWHDGPFRNSKDGLTEKKAPPSIQEKALGLDEVRDIQECLILNSSGPNSFFNTDGYIWYHTGKAGKAPDFLGFHPEKGISIVEVKWLAGWQKSLHDQVMRYVEQAKGSKSIPLEIWVISAQGLSESVKKLLLDLPEKCKSNFGFHEVKIHLGQFFVGWDDDENFFIKLEWL